MLKIFEKWDFDVKWRQKVKSHFQVIFVFLFGEIKLVDETYLSSSI